MPVDHDVQKLIDALRLEIAQVRTENGRLRTMVVEQGTRLKAVEDKLAAGATVPESLAKIAERLALLGPLAERAQQILDVQAGALGVRP